MGRIILNEVSELKFTLKESTQPEQGVLATISGIFAEYGKPNKNRRMYSEDVWNRVVENEDIQKAIQGKRMYGELDHPEDYLDIKIDKTALCVTKLELDRKNKTVLGEAKVLDTPAGKILNTLLRFGSVLGVSSRASGELDNEGNVIPETYEFITFDVVTNPSNAGALPTLRESTEHSLETTKKALLESIDTADHSQLPIIESIANGMDKEMGSEIIYKIEERKAKLQEKSSEFDEVRDRLDVIESKLDELLELIKEHYEPEDQDADDEIVDDPEDTPQLREAVQIKAKKRRVLAESFRGETRIPVSRVVEVTGASVSDSDRSEKLVRANKSK